MSALTPAPALPTLPGYTVRLYRGEADIPALRAVLQADQDAGGGEGGVTLEQMLNFYRHLTNCDPARDLLMVEGPDGLVAYGRVWWHVEHSSSIYLYRLAVHVRPEARGQGLGRALLAWLEARSLGVAAELGHPAGAAFWQAEDNNRESAKAAALARAGYAVARDYTDMLRPDLDGIPDRRLPAGVYLRAAQPEHYAAIWQAKAEGFRETYGAEQTAQDYARWLSDTRMFQPEIWKVAWDTARNEVVGMVLGYIDIEENEELNRRRGYTENIGVRRDWRRRGIASALIAASLRELKAHSMTEAALTVETENTPAFDAYTAMGFRPELRVVVYRKPFPVESQP